MCCKSQAGAGELLRSCLCPRFSRRGILTSAVLPSCLGRFRTGSGSHGHKNSRGKRCCTVDFGRAEAGLIVAQRRKTQALEADADRPNRGDRFPTKPSRPARAPSLHPLLCPKNLAFALRGRILSRPPGEAHKRAGRSPVPPRTPQASAGRAIKALAEAG